MNRKTNQQQFDNEMKALAQGVYQENEEAIPKSWINFAEHKNNKTGFYRQAFYKDGKIILALKGTDPNDVNNLFNDAQMVVNHLPLQYSDAQDFYEEIKKIFQIRKLFLQDIL